jgi:hypothetical protein
LRLDNTFSNEIFLEVDGSAEGRFLRTTTMIPLAQRRSLMTKDIKRMVIEFADRQVIGFKPVSERQDTKEKQLDCAGCIVFGDKPVSVAIEIRRTDSRLMS